MTPAEPQAGPLAGMMVVDMSTMMAGPQAAMLLADFGATVVKVEPKQGDPSRRSGWEVNETSVWWRQLGRNKDAVTIDLKKPRGKDLMLRLLEKSDVLIENMRPGKLEALGLGREVLHGQNAGLVILRVTGWGQDGPYSGRASFGTQAEAMSGFAEINGQEDGPPTLPPIPLADGVAGYLGAFSVLAALRHRDQTTGGVGQVIDLSIFEALLGILGPQFAAYQQLGVVPRRRGSRTAFFAPRNVYQCGDGRWVGLSAAAEQSVPRVFAAMGQPELYDDPRFSSIQARVENMDELDEIIQAWVGSNNSELVITTLSEAGASVAPIYTVEDILDDPHFRIRNIVKDAASEDAGPIAMQNVFPRFERTPGGIRWSGKGLGADNEYWFREKLGIEESEYEALAADGVI